MPNSAKRARDRHAKKTTVIGKQIAAGKKRARKKKKTCSKKSA